MAGYPVTDVGYLTKRARTPLDQKRGWGIIMGDLADVAAIGVIFMFINRGVMVCCRFAGGVLGVKRDGREFIRTDMIRGDDQKWDVVCISDT